MADTTGGISAKERFRIAYEREHATTRKILQAYPPDKGEIRPAEKSNSAQNIAWTFVIEEQLMLRGLTGQHVLGSAFPTPPDSWTGILEAFDKGHEEVMAQLRRSDNANLDGTATFFVAPKQTGEIPLEEFVWFMLHDQIHHRGQLSVYLRIAGGKLPSIYGPTADEPWN